MHQNSDSFMKGKEIVHIEGTFLAETEKANLVAFMVNRSLKDCWLPKSQFSEPLEILDVDTGECSCLIPRWLADKYDVDYEELDPEEVEDAGEEGHEPDFDDDTPF
jgi:hypothetical protein